jgi:hypothetical protein
MLAPLLGLLFAGALASLAATRAWRLRAPLCGALVLVMSEAGSGTGPTVEFGSAYKNHVLPTLALLFAGSEYAAGFVGVLAGALLGALMVRKLTAGRVDIVGRVRPPKSTPTEL